MNFSTESTPPMDETTTISGIAETAKSLEDLGHLWPSDLVCHGINMMNETVGLEWYQSIIAATLMTRFALFPLAIYAMRGTSRLAHASPEMKPIQEAYKKNQISAHEMADRLQSVYKKFGISSPLAPFAGIICQVPFFMSFFFCT